MMNDENQKTYDVNPMTKTKNEKVKEIMEAVGFNTNDDYVEIETKIIKFDTK